MTAYTPNAEDRRRAATEQAAAWLVALRGGRLSAGERGEFVDWLRESPVHIAEMLRVSQIDQALGGFSRWGEIPTAERTVDNVVRLLPEAQHPPPRRTRLAMVSRAIAAGLAIVVVATGGWLALKEKSTVVRTQLAERREMTLADGSVVNVAPLSELRIRFTSDRRSIELLEGHVLFDVAKDPRRPFVVEAGEATVRAVGTSFDVERAPQGVRVTVIEGRVSVVRRDTESGGDAVAPSGASAQVLLAANEEVVVPARGAAPAVREVNGAAQAAWATGTLVFEDETVAEVVRRFNLHNRAQIQILDPRLGGRRISGTFKASDPESFVDFIRATSDEQAHDHSALLLERRTR